MTEALSRDPRMTVSTFWSSIRKELRADANHLRAAFHAKCAYCEQRMEHVSRGQIEHYRPKSSPEFRDRVFDWGNWLFSCGRCNEKKWAHFPSCGDLPCLLDPTTDNPSEHVQFDRHVLMPRSDRGMVTINPLKLNDSPLDEERSRWLMHLEVAQLIAAIGKHPEIGRRFLIWSMRDEAPFSAMSRQYVHFRAPKLADPEQPHPEIHITDIQAEIANLAEIYWEDIAELD